VALICDTGALYATFDSRDVWYVPCSNLLESTPERAVVPAPTVIELDWLVSRRLPQMVFDAFLADIEDGALTVLELHAAEYSRCRQLRRQYADLPLGFVDAAVIAVAERLGEDRIFTVGRGHFSVVRPRHARSFTLLPRTGA
jgi:uncharacterized protein